MSSRSDVEVAALDSSLAEFGEWIEIRRFFGTQLIPISVTCRAFVRAVDAKELEAGITQESSNIILSPSQIIAANWPGPWTPSASEQVQPDTDRRVPRKGDACIVKGRKRNIEVSKPIYVDDELVRIELRILG